MRINRFGLPDPAKEQESLREPSSEVEHQAQAIIRALEVLLTQARLARRNPVGMRHLLFLYGLHRPFGPELKAMDWVTKCEKQKLSGASNEKSRVFWWRRFFENPFSG